MATRLARYGTDIEGCVFLKKGLKKKTEYVLGRCINDNLDLTAQVAASIQEVTDKLIIRHLRN